MVVGGQCDALTALPLGKKCGTHCTGGLGPRAGVENLASLTFET